MRNLKSCTVQFSTWTLIIIVLAINERCTKPYTLSSLNLETTKVPDDLIINQPNVTNSVTLKNSTVKTRHRSAYSEMIEKNESIVQRMKLRLTQSRNAKWASFSFTLICILLLVGVCYSKMWREYRGTASAQPIPLFLIKERVPFIDVLRRKINLSKQLRKQKKARAEELRNLIQNRETYDIETSDSYEE